MPGDSKQLLELGDVIKSGNIAAVQALYSQLFPNVAASEALGDDDDDDDPETRKLLGPVFDKHADKIGKGGASISDEAANVVVDPPTKKSTPATKKKKTTAAKDKRTKAHSDKGAKTNAKKGAKQKVKKKIQEPAAEKVSLKFVIDAIDIYFVFEPCLRVLHAKACFSGSTKGIDGEQATFHPSKVTKKGDVNGAPSLLQPCRWNLRTTVLP